MNNIVVVDTSVVVKWIVTVSDSDVARALLAEWTHKEPSFSLRAIELASQFSLPATYDAHHLALAEREGCELWTADTRLWKAVNNTLPWVHSLSEYSTS